MKSPLVDHFASPTPSRAIRHAHEEMMLVARLVAATESNQATLTPAQRDFVDGAQRLAAGLDPKPTSHALATAARFVDTDDLSASAATFTQAEEALSRFLIRHGRLIVTYRKHPDEPVAFLDGPSRFPRAFTESVVDDLARVDVKPALYDDIRLNALMQGMFFLHGGVYPDLRDRGVEFVARQSPSAHKAVYFAASAISLARTHQGIGDHESILGPCPDFIATDTNKQGTLAWAKAIYALALAADLNGAEVDFDRVVARDPRRLTPSEASRTTALSLPLHLRSTPVGDSLMSLNTLLRIEQATKGLSTYASHRATRTLVREAQAITAGRRPFPDLGTCEDLSRVAPKLVTTDQPGSDNHRETTIAEIRTVLHGQTVVFEHENGRAQIKSDYLNGLAYLTKNVRGSIASPSYKSLDPKDAYDAYRVFATVGKIDYVRAENNVTSTDTILGPCPRDLVKAERWARAVFSLGVLEQSLDISIEPRAIASQTRGLELD